MTNPPLRWLDYFKQCISSIVEDQGFGKHSSASDTSLLAGRQLGAFGFAIVVLLLLSPRTEGSPILDNPSFETDGGWTNLTTGSSEYYAAPEGVRYAVRSANDAALSQETDVILEAGTSYTVTLWARSLYDDATTNLLLGSDPDTAPLGTNAQSIATVQATAPSTTLGTASVNVTPQPLLGAPTTSTNDDGANVWLDFDHDHRHAFSENHFYQPLASDPITDPWSVADSLPFNFFQPDMMAKGVAIFPDGSRRIYGFNSDNPFCTGTGENCQAILFTTVAASTAPEYQAPSEPDAQYVAWNSGDEDPWLGDPHIFVDSASGRVWLSFGGGSGMYVAELDPATGFILGTSGPVNFDERRDLFTLVADWSGDEWTFDSTWFEGVALYRQGDYWHLFTSNGDLSLNYTIRMGRGTSPTGPFFDRDGQRMDVFDPVEAEFGNSFLLGDDGAQVVPGHPHIWEESGKFYLGYDYRTAKDGRGANPQFDYMGIRPVYWHKGWPTIWTPITVTFDAEEFPQAIGQPITLSISNSGDPDSLLGVDGVSLHAESTDSTSTQLPQLSIRQAGANDRSLQLRTANSASQTQLLTTNDLAAPIDQWELWWTVNGAGVRQTFPFVLNDMQDTRFFRAVQTETQSQLGKVWCVGDSWTDCWLGTTWRRYLWQSLEAEGKTVDFVGVNRDDSECEPGQSYDRDHDGYGGITAEAVLAEIDGPLGTVNPDTMLLMIGGNDIETTPDFDVIMGQISGIVAKVRAKKPNIFIHLGMYGYVEVSISRAQADDFASRLQALTTSLNTSDSPVVFVDHRVGWDTTTDLDTDLFHPSPAGMAKIAANWLASIKRHQR